MRSVCDELALFAEPEEQKKPKVVPNFAQYKSAYVSPKAPIAAPYVPSPKAPIAAPYVPSPISAVSVEIKV